MTNNYLGDLRRVSALRYDSSVTNFKFVTGTWKLPDLHNKEGGKGALTPLTIEVETYFDLPRLNTSKVDVLGWWRAQQHTFPLLRGSTQDLEI